MFVGGKEIYNNAGNSSNWKILHQVWAVWKGKNQIQEQTALWFPSIDDVRDERNQL